MLPILAPPLPITLPTALAGTKISSVEVGGNLHRVMELKSRAIYNVLKLKEKSSKPDLTTLNTDPPYSLDEYVGTEV